MDFNAFIIAMEKLSQKLDFYNEENKLDSMKNFIDRIKNHFDLPWKRKKKIKKLIKNFY